jgi:hypothetical protein
MILGYGNCTGKGIKGGHFGEIYLYMSPNGQF